MLGQGFDALITTVLDTLPERKRGANVRDDEQEPERRRDTLRTSGHGTTASSHHGGRGLSILHLGKTVVKTEPAMAGRRPRGLSEK
jgi:hypothetical protein